MSTHQPTHDAKATKPAKSSPKEPSPEPVEDKARDFYDNAPCTD
jgi:hypothetical protein